jgi:hypothetical protein
MLRRWIDRLLITLGPRFGKSEFISKYFPAYAIGTNNDERVILASYEADFAAEWGRKVRELLEEDGEKYFDTKIRDDTRAADHWQVVGGIGGMQTCGVGGPLTGKGASILLIDDAFKNAEEANSETIRQKKWDWFATAAYTRLEPNGVIGMVGTRWHEADISGRILTNMKEGGEPWTYLHLPSLSDSNEVWAELTIPKAHAERLKIVDGQTFDALAMFLSQVQAA